MNQVNQLNYELIDTPLGRMVAVGDQNALYLLEFMDEDGEVLKRLRVKLCNLVAQGECLTTKQIRKELQDYFRSGLTIFNTPLRFSGTPFQIAVWEELRAVPFGQTISYKELAKRIGRPKAVRAVASANGANRFPIIVPCHRVVASNGNLGGYSAGIDKKKWLLSHEIRKKFGSNFASKMG